MDKIHTIDEIAARNPRVIDNGEYRFQVGRRDQGGGQHIVEHVVVRTRGDGKTEDGNFVGLGQNAKGETVTIPGNENVHIEPTARPKS